MKNRKRNRKLGFDYSSNAIYFLTICCKNRIHYFGQIENKKMTLNTNGIITDKQIKWLELQYSYFILHNYIVMPNHVHILAEINNEKTVRTGRDLSQQPSLPNPKIKSISELMGAFKTTSSKKIHLAGNNSFLWQRSFYDHIVRNNESYERIYNYISQNPAKWQDDTFNKTEEN